MWAVDVKKSETTPLEAPRAAYTYTEEGEVVVPEGKKQTDNRKEIHQTANNDEQQQLQHNNLKQSQTQQQ